MIKLKEFEITIKVKCDNLVNAKWCLRQMLNGLDKQQVWYSNLYNIREIKISEPKILEILTENIIKELKRLMFLKKSDYNSKSLKMLIDQVLKDL